MSTSALPPIAPTTLVILLGASAWPNSPGFQPSPAFVHAAWGFKYYVLDPQGFGLSTSNLLDLFDAPLSASDQLEMLGSFLEQQTQALKAANQAVRDVVVYFVGHGGFVGSSADFYLLPRRANASSLRASGMAIDALAEVLREKARQMRRYLFLDCCFASAAFRSFQGGPDQTAITKTLDAFQVQARSSGFPAKGTVLLCSSDQKSPSLLLPDESSTMFSHALLDVLRNGDLHRPLQLSLRDLKELAEERLAALPEKNAPRPGLHSPDQSEGDVADVPFFPNPHAREERMRNIAEQTAPLLSQTFPPTTSPHAVIPPQGPVPQSPIVSPRDAMLPGSALPMQPKRQRSPAVTVVLILLVLILLGGASLGIYRAVTFNHPVIFKTPFTFSV
ncbi:MAG: caspase family protein [Ktedonobacteraceae bacterium]